MQPWLIAIIIVAGLYVLLLIANTTFVISFYIIMNKHNRAIKIILKSKLDSLKELIKKMTNNWGMEINNEDMHLLDESQTMLDEKDFIKDCDEIKKNLSYINNELNSLCEENESIKNDDEYILIKENIKQLDSVYRSNVIMYNADVLGYNYWIRFLPFRYLWLLFRFKIKDLIS